MTEERKTRKPQITVAPRAAAVDIDSVIAKRLAGDPFADGAQEIPLRDPHQWDTYIANAEINPNRHYEMINRKGWVPLTVADLPAHVSPESIGWNVAEDGVTLCRGTRGQEVAYKMPKEIRAKIQAQKTALNKKGMGSAAQVKQDMAAAVGNQLGSEAADFAHKNISITGGDRQGPLGA